MEILPRHKDVWIGENVRLKNFLHFFAKKIGERKMFDVPLHRDLKEDRARKRHVRSANEMRSFFEGCLMLNV